jgi:hypothetical protein
MYINRLLPDLPLIERQTPKKERLAKDGVDSDAAILFDRGHKEQRRDTPPEPRKKGLPAQIEATVVATTAEDSADQYGRDGAPHRLGGAHLDFRA